MEFKNSVLLLITVVLMALVCTVSSTIGKFRMAESRYSDYEEMSSEQRLFAYIFRKYNKYVRPVTKPSESVNVNITFSLMQIHSLDEKTQVFRTYGWLVVQWTDRRLAWHVEEYENMTEFIVERNMIWTPELALINAVEWQFPNFDNYRAILNHDGGVRWEPAGVFETSCKIDITFYPYDQQECKLVFGTWAYTSHKVNFTNSTSSVITDDYSESGEWAITGTTVERTEFTYNCCTELSFSKVSATIYLDRRHRFFTMNLVLPCAMLSSLTLVTFLSPPDQGEKISLGISILLSFSVFMLSLSENMPQTSETLPLFGVFTTYVMLMNTTSVMLTVFVLNLHHRHDNKPVPEWVRRLIFNGLARVLCMQNIKHQTPQRRINTGRKSFGSHRDSSRKKSRDALDGFSLSYAAKQFSGQMRNATTTHHFKLPYSSPNKHNSCHNSNMRDHSNIYMEQNNYHNDPKTKMLDDHHNNTDGSGSGPDYSNAGVHAENLLRDLECQQFHLDEWKELARIMDRLFFWFTLLAMVTFCGSVFILAWF